MHRQKSWKKCFRLPNTKNFQQHPSQLLSVGQVGSFEYKMTFIPLPGGSPTTPTGHRQMVAMGQMKEY